MGCCGKTAKLPRGGTVKTERVKTEQGDYYTKYKYLTPQQLANKREKENRKIWCTGCDGGIACPASTYFKCPKRIQLGL